MTFDLAFPTPVTPVVPAMTGRRAFTILDETPTDAPAREALLDAAFGPARFLKTCERLRDGRRPAPGLALVAKDETDALIGTIRLWPILAGGRPALLLGPVAVAQEARSLGLGAGLIRESLHRAQALGHRAVLLVGDAPYYARFGFERRFTERLTLPGPVERARFLGLELSPGALAGVEGRVRAVAAVDAAALSRAA
ncbi:GNAT family N-acetyltransferase [Methylocystis echinoides]|uniref:GCN5 family N-acetyltransferase n=1 Tax=Methylocystis echinoides TaxID=29468 RepID=A0A9W6LR10_9HYPH|nr:N-acetyltransferase [Methylocystis echinoides]GLI91926.1 GCN5 family N-acetyltransferase [Methylocystis echinoides]